MRPKCRSFKNSGRKLKRNRSRPRPSRQNPGIINHFTEPFFADLFLSPLICPLQRIDIKPFHSEDLGSRRYFCVPLTRGLQRMGPRKRTALLSATYRVPESSHLAAPRSSRITLPSSLIN